MFGLIIVEDDPLIRKSLCRDFPWEDYGFRLLGDASDGKAGLEMARRLRPEAVLTDIRMPVLDGLGLLEALRGDEPAPAVVLLSAYDEFRYAQKGLNAGAFAYILKTDVFDEMEATMRRLAGQLRQRPGASEGADEEELLRRNSTAAIQYALDYIPTHLSEGLRVSELAARFHLSANYFSQRFHQETGGTYGNYVKALRLKRAVELLSQTRVSLERIARETGFQNVQYFCRFFKAETNQTPTQYRKQHHPDAGGRTASP